MGAIVIALLGLIIFALGFYLGKNAHRPPSSYEEDFVTPAIGRTTSPVYITELNADVPEGMDMTKFMEQIAQSFEQQGMRVGVQSRTVNMDAE